MDAPAEAQPSTPPPGAIDMNADNAAAKPTVPGVADTRGISLDRLAGEGARTAVESLRRVVPTDEEGRVPVCAFGSSI